ncbi:chromosome partitioning protein ParA [Salmonella enterica subsp. enterica]|nr:chromosome partitioning protein ParA [Salmonella enterica subsp. enterica]EEJ7209114.1 AAA family ATPase [Salmonella enterica subsp. enterica]
MAGKITIVGSNKGGASKSTTAVNLAVGLALRGHDTALLDADIQRSASKWHQFRLEAGHQPAITVMQGSGNIAPLLRDLANRYEHVIVDVAGRNSRELLTAGGVADIIIAPHLCSQFDLDTLEELERQLEAWHIVNPELVLHMYQTRSNPHASLRKKERKDFLRYLEDFPTLKALEAINFERQPYRDVIPEGLGILETTGRATELARLETKQLIEEVYG